MTGLQARLPAFLPSAAAQLVNLRPFLERLEQTALLTPLSPEPLLSSYVRMGTGGPPVLLFHGFDSSVLEFFRLMPLLARHWETWAVDLLGFGFTERQSGFPYGPEAIKQHLHCFWKEQIGEPVLLVGASMGGAAAIDFALSYPEAVAKLVLIDSVGFTFGPPIYKYLFAPFDYLAVEFWRALKHHSWTPDGAPEGPILREAQHCSTLHTSLPHWNESLVRFSRSGGYEFLTPQIGRVKQETLILWGETDAMLGTADAERFSRAISRSTLRWIACGHTPHIEQPEITAKHILRFGCSALSPSGAG